MVSCWLIPPRFHSKRRYHQVQAARLGYMIFMIWALLHMYVDILTEYSSTQGSVVLWNMNIFVRLYLCGSVKSDYLYINVGIQLARKDLEQLQQHITEEPWCVVCLYSVCVHAYIFVFVGVFLYVFVSLCVCVLCVSINVCFYLTLLWYISKGPSMPCYI